MLRVLVVQSALCILFRTTWLLKENDVRQKMCFVLSAGLAAVVLNGCMVMPDSGYVRIPEADHSVTIRHDGPVVAPPPPAPASVPAPVSEVPAPPTSASKPASVVESPATVRSEAQLSPTMTAAEALRLAPQVCKLYNPRRRETWSIVGIAGDCPTIPDFGNMRCQSKVAFAEPTVRASTTATKEWWKLQCLRM